MAVRMGGLSKKFLNNKSFVYVYICISFTCLGPCIYMHKLQENKAS